MWEILERGGLGRLGSWTRDGVVLRTPAVLFLHREDRPSPSFAEALFVEERGPDARVQVRLSGSTFSAVPASHPYDLPPTRGLPLSVTDLEVHADRPAGDLALVTSEASLEEASASPMSFLANGIEYLRHPREFAFTMARARQVLGPARILGITGIAAPSNLSILVYAGIDLVDSSRMVLDSARRLFHTADGVAAEASVDRASCGCAACSGDGGLLAHNELALHRELLLVRNHLVHGRLRELVERRLANDPWNTSVLRHLDLRHGDLLEQYTPVTGGEMLAYSHESLTRPEVVRFRSRVRERYARPPSARVLLLLPCSARKPYSASQSHRRFRDAILAAGNPSLVHEVIVTSPLGLVPRELERFHPARSYDIAVTGDWSRDEAAMVTEDLRAYASSQGYDAVVAHLGSELPAVRVALPEVLVPSTERPASDEALRALTKTLADAVASFARVPQGRRFAEEISNIAAFQFGPPGRQLVDGTAFRGRFPNVRVFHHGVQRAVHTARGMFSLSLAGGEVLSHANRYCVEIEDFFPEGNIFAVGVVAASEDIRIGDEVAVRHGAEVRAVGSARMTWREMVDSKRGEAVRVRHAAAGKP